VTVGATVGLTTQQLTSQGLEAPPPTSGPRPTRGKTVFWVSCGPIAPDCAVPVYAAQQAAQKLGLTFKIIDGKLNVGGGYVAAMQTAIAARPNAIIVHGMDCELLKSQLNQAHSLGIITLAVETPTCPDDPTAFTGDLDYAPKIPNTEAYFEAWGKLAAEYIIANTAGKAKIIANLGTDSVFPAITKGFLTTLHTCPGCQIVDTLDFASADQVPNGPAIQRLRAALVKDADANVVFFPTDYLSATLGGAEAAKQAHPNILVVDGGSGTAQAMALVRSGTISAIGGTHDPQWMGYAAMDAVNRLLQGKPQVPEGVGVRAVDKSTVQAAPGPYKSPINWLSAYDLLWNH
jgi:ribose transport system substrate-binding protein